MKKWFLFWYETNEEVIDWIIILVLCLGLALFAIFLKFWILIGTLVIGLGSCFFTIYLRFKLGKEKRRSRRIS